MLRQNIVNRRVQQSSRRSIFETTKAISGTVAPPLPARKPPPHPPLLILLYLPPIISNWVAYDLSTVGSLYHLQTNEELLSWI